MCSHRPLYPRSSPRDVDDIVVVVVVVVVVVLSVVVASSLCATRTTTTTRPPQRRRRGWRSNAIMQTFFVVVFFVFVSFVPGATRPFRQKALLPSFCWATFSNVGVPSKLETIDRSSPFELLLQSKKQKSGKKKTKKKQVHLVLSFPLSLKKLVEKGKKKEKAIQKRKFLLLLTHCAAGGVWYHRARAKKRASRPHARTRTTRTRTITTTRGIVIETKTKGTGSTISSFFSSFFLV